MDPAELIEMKIVMVGDIGAGKTCLTTQFIRNQYSETTQPTIGASYMWKECLVAGQKVKFSVWDTAGQEQYHSLVPIYFRSAAAVVLLYDVTSAQSLAGTKNWESQIRSNAPQEAITALVGNKVDLEDKREVAFEEAQAVKQAYGADLLFECSAKVCHWVVGAILSEGKIYSVLKSVFFLNIFWYKKSLFFPPKRPGSTFARPRFVFVFWVVLDPRSRP